MSRIMIHKEPIEGTPFFIPIYVDTEPGKHYPMSMVFEGKNLTIYFGDQVIKTKR